MNGEFCRFCNHHVNDHEFRESPSAKFEIQEDHIVVIYDTEILRQQAAHSDMFENPSDHKWTNIQLLASTIYEE